MNSRTFNVLGGFQSMLFCIGIYVVALFFSIFICSAIFHAVNNYRTEPIGTLKTVSAPQAGPQVVASR
ncbi:hypothetical protein [Flavihumibacter sp. UBA7668]|uniref:hypothetical protein n=1 Tax=Flavihumibacter sp. UBA7668 TaxID=1946542 RepID=UPI0025C6D092|nr:hypothetical protein [Flavihumibacter sp. UBA7668]